MSVRIVFSLLLVTLFAGCDQTPDQVYSPPTLSGKAYVLAAADHLAVVDLANARLTRIKMNKQGRDLAIANGKLYILAEDGSIASLQDETNLTPWQKGLPGAVAMTAGPDNSLWLLAQKELQTLVPGQGLGMSIPLAEEYSSLFFGEGPETIWLVSRKKSSVTPLNLTTKTLGASIDDIGNSVHHGFSFPGTNELWVAEGNEYRNGEPYGVGYATKGPAMPGGINIIDLKTSKQSDFIMIGGNVVDLAIPHDKNKVYAAISQMPDYTEATLAVIDAKSKRTITGMQLCDSCHQNENITLAKGKGKVLALAIF
ncbi:MAG: hypothetical protein PHI06_07865 [Desulfobulbaceae bacterium]|nr:hypothetical protein [Desulfobulbaceae bacterium]